MTEETGIPVKLTRTPLIERLGVNADDISAEIEACFSQHFGSYSSGTEIAFALEQYHRDLRMRLGLSPIAKAIPATEPGKSGETSITA
jgi:hypothetical protein